jgi:glyoxylase-like metal-dependent hydrolase (beta-lactamase superfamily II)
VHFINACQGNMTLLELDDGKKFIYDCNITDDNADGIFDYLEQEIGKRTKIDTFICSHRDADHMRGVKRLHDPSFRANRSLGWRATSPWWTWCHDPPAHARAAWPTPGPGVQARPDAATCGGQGQIDRRR